MWRLHRGAAHEGLPQFETSYLRVALRVLSVKLFNRHIQELIMALLALGVGFGLTVGAGIFFLLIRPALKERAEAEAANMNSLARDKISNSCEPETDATKERQDQ